MLKNTLPINNHRARAEPDPISLSRCAFDAPPGRILLTFMGFCASEVRTSARRSTQAAENAVFRQPVRIELNSCGVSPGNSARESLVEATGRLVVARGVEATTMNHIAKEAGVDIASLFQYFANECACTSSA